MKQKFINIQKAYESTKPSDLCSQKIISNNVYVFFKDGASGKQVGDIEKIIIVKNLFKI